MSSPGPARGTVAQIRGAVAAYALRLVVSAITGIVIARALAPEGRGSYAVIVIIATIATTLGHLSLGHANISMWALHRSAIPATNLVLGPPLGALTALLVGLCVLVFGFGSVPAADHWLLIVALASVPAAVATVHMTTVVLLVGRMGLVNWSLTLAAAIQCAALLAWSLSSGLTIEAVIWIWVITSVVPLLLMLPAIRPLLSAPNAGLAQRLIAMAAQYHIGVVGLFLLLRVDVLLLNALAPLAAVGLYSVAVSVGELAHAGTDALSQAMIGRQADRELAAASDVTMRATRIAVLIAVLSVTGLCLAAPIVIPIVYGEAFRGSVPVLFALAPGIIAYAGTRALAPFLMRLERPLIMSALSLAALAVNVTLNLILIPKWGIVGCGIATSAGYLVLAVSQIAWFSRAAGVSKRQLAPTGADARLIWNAMTQELPWQS